MTSVQIKQCAATFFCVAQLIYSQVASAAEADTKGFQGDIKKFQSAYFGSQEPAVRQAILTDFNVKDSDIKASEEGRSGMRILDVNLTSFRPFDLPATVRYMFGYKCHCLNQVNVNWHLPEQISNDKRDLLLASVAELVKHLSERDWPNDQVVTDRAIGDVKAGASLPFVFFRGVNTRNTVVLLSGEPVQIQPDKENAGKFSADFEKMRTLQLLYQLDSKNPDVRKINVEGF